MTASERAVAYFLRRLRSEPRIAYHFGHTECLALMLRASAETNGLDFEKYAQEFHGELKTEPPTCRSGKCVLAANQEGRGT